MRELACAEVREMLPSYVDEPGRDLALRRHVGSCETCRQEVGRYEQMSRGLHALSTLPVDAPADLLPALMAIPDADNAVALVKTHVARNRKAYLSGAAVRVAVVEHRRDVFSVVTLGAGDDHHPHLGVARQGQRRALPELDVDCLAYRLGCDRGGHDPK